MERFSARFLLFISLLFLTQQAKAALVEVSISCSTTAGEPTNTLLQTACNELKSSVEEEANGDLPEVNLDEFSKGFANAAVMASKGGGTDYANDFALFVVSAGAGIGLDTRDTEIGDAGSDGDSLAGGAAAMGHLTVGLNLSLLPISKIGPIDFSKLAVFGNMFSYSAKNDSDDLESEYNLKSFGVMARYNFIDPVSIVPGGIVKWGGVQIHTGYQYNKFDIEVEQTEEIEEEETLTGTNTTIELAGEATASFTSETTVHSIPLEVSTSIQLLYVFSLYGGLGTDFAFGNNKTELEADADLEDTSNDNSISVAANISVDEDDTQSPDSMFFRGFVGAQFNVPFVKVFVEAHKAFGKNALSAHFGLRVLF